MSSGSEAHSQKPRKFVFLWNNFGPMHADRVDAVARTFPDATCVGLELFAQDQTYDWVSEGRETFQKITLHPAGRSPGLLDRIAALIRQRMRHRNAVWFLCHYEYPEILLLAVLLRLTGAKVFTMNCSKLDDFERTALREWVKTFYLRPYHGAIGSPDRSIAYYRFLGMRKRPVASPYNTLSIDRMRAQARSAGTPQDLPFDQRDWVIVARLVPKKNLALALEAYALYKAAGGTRRLHLCGNGPLEADLRAQAERLGITEDVVFHGFIQSEEISARLARSLALILPSIEEQFGNVVIEAQAFGLPVMLSHACGAADMMVRSWQNGFIFETDNAVGLARFMGLIDRDEALWRELSEGALASAPRCDVDAFAAAVSQLCPGH